MKKALVGFGLLGLSALVARVEGADPAAPAPTPVPPHLAEEFRVKREEIFEFAKKPVVTREGDPSTGSGQDKVTIAFATKGFCDATVAIENREGRILRHLASGVLGPKAPPPFQRNSKEQTLIWDSKNDKGEYVDDRANTLIRVSLGLRARFERHYLWSPHRRHDPIRTPTFAAQPEGVYVFDGFTWGFIRLFDHQGNYARTVYPFPSAGLDKLAGVRTRVFEQSGKTLPWKSGFLYSSLLTSGNNTRAPHGEGQVFYGSANSAMAIRDGRIALAYHSLNRLATDGTTGGLPLEGAETQIDATHFPRSIALSPDGKTAYVTGFYTTAGVGANSRAYWYRGVRKVDMAAGKKGDKMETFAGVLNNDPRQGGSKPGQFTTPTSVDVDPQGRVYVTDVYNHRVQVFDPAGKHLKDIPVHRPAEVCVSPLTGDLYVFSWALDCHAFRKGYSGYGGDHVQPKLTHFGPFDDPKVRAEYTFPVLARLCGDNYRGTQCRATVNHWAPGDTGPEIWLISGQEHAANRGQVQILRRKKGENALEVVKDFRDQAAKDVPSLAALQSAQLCVNPRSGELYIPAASLVVSPETGRIRPLRLPQVTAEMSFDLDGNAYFCTGTMVARYAVSDTDQWREVPFDYGEERAGRLSVLVTGGSPYHTGGVSVSPKGHVVAAVIIGSVKEPDPEKEKARQQSLAGATPWNPLIYEGRGGNGIVRVWDKHGKVLHEDAVMGIGYMHNVFMDARDTLYVTTGAQREGYRDVNTGMVVKMAPRSRILTDKSVLPLKQRPGRPPEGRLGAIGGSSWWEGAEWFYGGIGMNGKNSGGIHPCHCKQFRVAHDYYARTFVPESVHYTVAVLDSEGNVIMRIGQYGNVDEGVATVPDPRIPKPRPLGGDETAFFHPAYLAVHTDKRLFVNDPGNDRILSVKLDYHTGETVELTPP